MGTEQERGTDGLGLLWWLPSGRVEEIEPEALLSRLEGSHEVQIVDVRTSGEWRRSHIRGSRCVPITKLRKELPRLGLDPEKPVVAICLSAHRSIPAVRALGAAGFSEVTQLRGGMRAWWAKGLPTESA